MENKKHYQPLIVPVATWNQDVLTNTYGECVVKPLEPSFGHTIANSLRRILLGGIESSAISSVIILGVNNEFSVLPGVYDDILTILLRLQQLIIRNTTGEDGVIRLVVKKAGVVCASDCQTPEHLSIINTDFVITTLAEGVELNIQMFVTSGRGYVKTDWSDKKQFQEDGRIFLNATYTPVTNVSFEVQKTRVGNNIGYDEVILKITTNGAITPIEAFEYTISVIINQFKGLIEFSSIVSFESKLVPQKNILEKNSAGNALLVEDPWKMPALKENFSPDLFLKSIDILGLPARAHNCLVSAGIEKIIDLVNMTEQDIWMLKNFGKKSYDDLVQIMKELGLSFEMNINEKQIIKYMEKKNETSNKK
jgi:DNA-directed RNA polymerase subunit alpha